MLNKIGYGTYILFGLLTFIGAGFIWFFVSIPFRPFLPSSYWAVDLSYEYRRG
jgi:hypothetical protein